MRVLVWSCRQAAPLLVALHGFSHSNGWGLKRGDYCVPTQGTNEDWRSCVHRHSSLVALWVIRDSGYKPRSPTVRYQRSAWTFLQSTQPWPTSIWLHRDWWKEQQREGKGIRTAVINRYSEKRVIHYTSITKTFKKTVKKRQPLLLSFDRPASFAPVWTAK